MSKQPDFTAKPVTRMSRPISRRNLLKQGGLLATSCGLINVVPQVTENLANAFQAADDTQRNRLPRMVHEYFVDRVAEIEEAANRRRDAIKSKADAEGYVEEVRWKIRQSFGPFPEKADLKARVTGRLDRDGYHVENVIFESRPGFLVTANLYVPDGKKTPSPGVIGTCGHSTNGKAAGAYQSFAQGLARQGYVVLIYDPISQGERLQYPDKDLKSEIRPGVGDHLYGGNQQFLVGDFLGTWRAWDGIRALDYLLTRPEVDPQQIGVTGNSGGGTMTTWLCGLDDRYTMAAPSCFVTRFSRNLENELPADTEQCPPQAIALGLDHSDFIAAMAPKPVILLGQEKDFFDARGLEESYGRLKRLYTALGHPDNISLFMGPTYHGYSVENRQAMYRWFNRVTGVSDLQTEPELTLEPDEKLYCAPRGQVVELQSRPIYEFTAEKSRRLASERKRPVGDELRTLVRRTLRLPEVNGVPDYRIPRVMSAKGYPTAHAANYLVETEPGILVPVYRLSQETLMSRPPQSGPRAVLYVSHLSSDVELKNEPLLQDVVKAEPESAVFTCDVRGVGESRPNTCGGTQSYQLPYGSDYFYAIHSLMLDQPYLGQRTFDVLRVLAWLKSIGHDQVHVVGLKYGTLPATFAALFADNVTQVTLKQPLTSYAGIAEAKRYDWPLSGMLPGVLQSFDLPDCYSALEGKQLRILEPFDGKLVTVIQTASCGG